MESPINRLAVQGNNHSDKDEDCQKNGTALQLTEHVSPSSIVDAKGKSSQILRNLFSTDPPPA
jgi:hypothetical protein